MSDDRPFDTKVGTTSKDRRRKPRTYDSFPARVLGVDVDGRKFETEVTLENLSSSGLCAFLPNRMELGTDLLALIRFLAEWYQDGSYTEDTYARVAAWGKIVRSKVRSDGTNETAVAFKGHIVL